MKGFIVYVSSFLTMDYGQFYQGVRGEYIDHLEKEHDITTTIEYLDHVRVFDEIENPNEFRAYLQENDFGLELLFQIVPALGQDVHLLSSNPGLQDDMTTDIFNDNREFGRRKQQESDLSGYAETLAKNLHGYLSSSNGFSRIIPRLQDGLSLLSSTEEVPFEEYIRPEKVESGAQNLFSETYYNRIYKYPSYDETALTSEDLEFGIEKFHEEVDQLFDPTVFVATGKVAWHAIYEMVEDPDEDILGHNDSHVTSSFAKFDKGGARGGVYEIPERNLWILTTRHGSYYPDTDRLEDNISYIDQRL